MKVKKAKELDQNAYASSSSREDEPAGKSPPELMTTYQNGLPSIYEKNRYGFAQKNFENLQKVYQNKLKDLEVNMLQNNIQQVVLQKIMDMVEPTETWENSLSNQFNQVINDRKTCEDLDTKSIEELENTFSQLQGTKFFDPDIQNEVDFYKMKSTRTTNKERSK